MRALSDLIPLLTRHAKSRGGWLGYGLLVGLSLSMVAVSLFASHRQSLLSDEMLDLHQAWSNRLARYGRIGQLSLAIFTPSNEVFDSGNLQTESARSRRARMAFDAEMDSARLELAQIRRGASSSVILKDLEVVQATADSLSAEVGRTFASYDVGPAPDVSVIDGYLARIHEKLNRLGHHAREAQGLESMKLLDSAAFLQRLTSVVLALIAVLVVVIALIVRRASLRVATVTPERVILPAATIPAVPQRSEARLPPILDTAPDPVITLDESGRITGWNVHAEKAFGRFSDEMRGRRFSETVIAPRHRETVARGLLRFVEAGDKAIVNRRLEISALDHQGREIPIELAIVPSRIGEATTFSAFLRDMTERTRADDQLRRLSLVASKTANGVLITDAQGRTEWVNDAFVRISGYSLEELNGKTLDALLRGPHAEPAEIDRMVEAIRSGTAFRVELAIDTREGRPYWIEVEATPIQDDGGTLSKFIAIVTDISERKRVEAELRESEARTRAIIEGVVDGIVTIDDLGNMTTVNPAAERIFGYRSKELIGKHVRMLMPCLGDGAPGQNPEDELEVGPWSITGGGRRKNGSAFPIELSVSEARFDERKMWTCIVRDITRRKQAEALRVGQNRVLELLASGAPLAGALTELIRIVEEQQPGMLCMVQTLDPGETYMRVVAAPSLTDDLARAVEAIEIGPSACSWGAAAYLRKRVIVEDTAIHPLWADYRKFALDFGLRSSWAEPMLAASGHALGVFAAIRRRVHTPVGSEIELISFAAHVAAIAIERNRATEALKAYTLEGEEAGSRAD